MKVIVTGSLGNVSQPLAELLVRQGHQVTVISSDPRKVAPIHKLGATAAIGSLTDRDFLQHTLTGGDALYAMLPFSLTAPDHLAYQRQLATNYVHAIQHTGLPRAVVLSGWAADLVPAASVEDVFAPLPQVARTFLRPAYFYSNFYQSLVAIKQTGRLTATFGEDDRLVFVSPQDIAAVAAEELVTTTPSHLRYVGSEEMSCTEAARTIGAAIGLPTLPWTRISPGQMRAEYERLGLPMTLAQSLVDMQAVLRDGTALATFRQANPALGQVKLAEFAHEFAAVYHAS
jgi:NAD(P)H dehydrogenase (quinone)